jgi:hypothetical protein
VRVPTFETPVLAGREVILRPLSIGLEDRLAI